MVDVGLNWYASGDLNPSRSDARLAKMALADAIAERPLTTHLRTFAQPIVVVTRGPSAYARSRTL